MENVKKEEVIKVREDLNKMVSQIKFEEVGTAKYPRKACMVTLWTGKKIEFADKNGELYDYLLSFVDTGKEKPVKSVCLCEEVKKDASLDFGEGNDENSKTYICVKYTLNSGATFRLFPAKKFGSGIIINYYDAFKKQQVEQKSTAPKIEK